MGWSKIYSRTVKFAGSFNFQDNQRTRSTRTKCIVVTPVGHICVSVKLFYLKVLSVLVSLAQHITCTTFI